MSSTTPLAVHQRAILVDQKLEVRTLLGGEFQEDLLAFRILEPFTVPLEEPV